MWKMFWIVIALALAVISADPAVDNEEVVQDAEHIHNNAEIPANMPEQELPSPAELLKMLDSMQGISDEDKENLRAKLLKNMGNLGESMADSMDDLPSGSLNPTSYQLFVLLGFLTFMALVFGFFGYKLYQTLVAREKRKEMKKKQKELKKKK